MAVENKSQLKTYFETGDIPTQSNFENLIDSLIHVDELSDLGLPFTNLFSEDFQNDIGGWAGFNNGTATYDAANNRVECGTSGSGISHTPSSLVEGKKYRVYLDITLGTASVVNLIPKWNVNFGVMNASGQYYFEWVQPAGGQTFGGDLILTRPTGSGTFYLNEFKLWEFDENSTIYTKNEVDDLVDALEFNALRTLYSEDFTDGTFGESTTFGSVTKTVANDQLTLVFATGTNNISGFGPRLDREPMKIGVYIDVESLTGPIQIKSSFNSPSNFIISSPGVYHILLSKTLDYANNELERMLIFADDNGGNRTVVLNHLEIYDVAEEEQANSFDPNTDNVVLGNGATTESENQRQVAIGKNTDVDQLDSVAIGTNAKAKYSQWYTAVNQNEATAIGHDSYAHGWRCTALGAKAHAGGQSSTAIGTGTVARGTHGCAIGRGVISPSNAQGGQNVTVLMNHEIYFENNWGHKMSRPESEISVGSVDTPNTHEVILHGFDAFDARFELWNSATSYNAGDWVQILDGGSATDGLTGDVYQALTANTNSNPASNPSDWAYRWQTAGGGPDSYNVDGGHIALHAGRSTGTGVGGEVRIYADRNIGSAGQNTKNSLDQVAKFSSGESSGTHLWLLDANNGTMYQVKIGSDGSGPGGSGRALYID